MYYENYIIIEIPIPDFEELKKKYFDNNDTPIVLLNKKYYLKDPLEYFNPVMLMDRTGHFAISASVLIVGAILGAVIGAGAEVGKQVITNDGDWSKINVGSVVSSAILGGALGFAGAAGGAALGAVLAGSGTMTAAGALGWYGISMGVSFSGGVLGYTADKLINGQTWNLGDAMVHGGFAMIEGTFAYGAGAISSLVELPGQVGKLTYKKIGENFVNDIFSQPITWILDLIGDKYF